MEYTRSEYVGEVSTDEKFEGEPKEILELINGMKCNKEEKEGLIYDTDAAIEYINENVDGLFGNTKEMIKQILELDQDYMRSVGIIEA